MSQKTLPAILFTALILVAGIFFRYDNLTGHFTHIDDLLVATNLIQKGRVELIHEDIQAGVSPVGKTYENSRLYKTLSSIESPFEYFLTYNFIRLRTRFWRIAAESTYAPLQGAITSFFLNSGESGYDNIKTKGRLLSFFAGILSMFACVFLILRYFENDLNKWWLAALGAAMLAFSWENIIYAQQMSPYAISVLLHCLLLLLLLKNGNKNPSWKLYLKTGLLAGLLAWGQYQLLFTAVPFMFVFFLIHRKVRLYWKAYLAMGVGFSLAVFPLLEYLIIRGDSGVHWNAGIHQQFYFLSAFNKTSWGETLLEMLLFFPKNIFLTTRGMIGFVPDENNALVFFFTALFLLLSATGFYSLLRNHKENHSRKLFFLYVVSLSVFWILLICAGKLTLSPTRHSLVLMPPGILLSMEGIQFLFRNKISLLKFTCTGILVIEATAFTFTYEKGKEERTDKISEDLIHDILKRHSPELVISYLYTNNISLYALPASTEHVLMQQPMYINIDFAQEPERFAPLKKDPGKIVLISTRDSWKKEFENKIQESTGFSMTGYKLIDKLEIHSDVEVEYSSLTQNGTNALYYYVLSK
jgi:hypothetical protein